MARRPRRNWKQIYEKKEPIRVGRKILDGPRDVENLSIIHKIPIIQC